MPIYYVGQIFVIHQKMIGNYGKQPKNMNYHGILVWYVVVEYRINYFKKKENYFSLK